MRSSELAAVAGVTVRTLRHYHQIGVLDEPERSVNGYRDYGVHHLVRILRITRLTGLGVPLAALPDVLDDPDRAELLLDDLDRRAATEIERLTRRRAVISDLRRHGAAPDLPPALAPYTHALRAGADVSAELGRYEHDRIVLLSHLLGETASVALADATARLIVAAPAARELRARFAALGPGTSEDDVRALAEDMAEFYRPFLAEIAPIDLSGAASPFLAAYTEEVLNEEQLRALELCTLRLS